MGYNNLTMHVDIFVNEITKEHVTDKTTGFSWLKIIILDLYGVYSN